MSRSNFVGMFFVGVGILFILKEISRQQSCGPNCQGLVSDAENAVVQNLFTGLFR